MSGPTTIAFSADPLSVLIAAAAIRAAMAVAEANASADAQQKRQDRKREDLQRRQDKSETDAHAELACRLDANETAYTQLLGLADSLGLAANIKATLPPRPAGNDFDTLAAYARARQALHDELRAILLSEAARRAPATTEAPGAALQTLPPAALTRAQLMLARVEHLGPLPDDIHNIALELDQSPPGERTELLATELGMRLQQQVERSQERAAQEACAVVLDHTLRNLGYQVEEIGHTLFVEGGVVHFRRSGWGGYMVRMRVDAKAATANFNVIRAVEAGNNERSVLDHLAEDRWCAEFPALLKALELQGMQLRVTRRLEAGELPVQLVDAAKLPAFADDEQTHTTEKPLTRTLP